MVHVPILAIISGIMITANLCINIGSNWNRIKIWLAECFYTYYKHIVSKKDNQGGLTTSFILITQFIDYIIKSKDEKDILKTVIVETMKVGVDTYVCQTIPGLATLEIQLDVSDERKNDLKLKDNKITFWILASGVYGSSPIGYEIWTASSEHLSDVYRILTLFFRHKTKKSNSNELINFTRNFRIMNKRIQNQTFRDLSRDVRASIREEFKNYMKYLDSNDTNYKVIEIDQYKNDNNLSAELKRTRQLDQLVQYMNKAGNYHNSNKLKFAACVKNLNIFFRKSLNTVLELEDFISFNVEKFGQVNARYMNSMAIILNFKTFLMLRHEVVNGGTTGNIEGMNSESLFDESFQDIVTITNRDLGSHPFIHSIMLIMYLEYNILKNEDKINLNENSMEDIINMLENPTDILFGKDKNLSLYQQFCTALNRENSPPPNSDKIVDHNNRISYLKHKKSIIDVKETTLNSMNIEDTPETSPLLKRRGHKSN